MWYRLIRSFLFLLPPEWTHRVGLSLLTTYTNFFKKSYFRKNHRLQLQSATASKLSCEIMGITFPNPIGLAAGLDRNGEYIEPLSHLGFGFIEIGTITPLAQYGNPKPRLFRLPAASALINRMGFNSYGVDYAMKKVSHTKRTIPLGINIGKNAITPLNESIADYLCCFEKVYDYADYITLNISSPNTQNLCDLQHGRHLTQLLSMLKRKQLELFEQTQRYVPIVIKLSPDLTILLPITEALLKYKIDGVIATNTTIDRKTVQYLPLAQEIGGLSGKPLRERSTQTVKRLYKLLGEEIPIIACGGIFTAEDVQEKFDAGAKLVQLYTGLIYQGPSLVKKLLKSLN